MQFLDKKGLSTFLAQLKNIFGYKSILDETMKIRQRYLLQIEYEKELAFDTTWIVPSNNSPYVGIAIVGHTCVA